MGYLKGKNILLVIPKSQFCEDELKGVMGPLKDVGANVVVLSKTGQEARGSNKTKFQPDGILVDWDKQPGIIGKYDAVLVFGGKGAAKSLWDDSILHQMLTDHYRSRKIVGAIGTSVVVLAKAGLIQNFTPAPDEKKTRETLEAVGVIPTDKPLLESDNILVVKDATFVKEFVKKIVENLKA